MADLRSRRETGRGLPHPEELDRLREALAGEDNPWEATP
jgi:hypothetical protein